jgi:hypothetical protein
LLSPQLKVSSNIFDEKFGIDPINLLLAIFKNFKLLQFSTPEKLIISLLTQVKLVKLENWEIFILPLNFGKLIPQLISVTIGFFCSIKLIPGIFYIILKV